MGYEGFKDTISISVAPHTNIPNAGAGLVFGFLPDQLIEHTLFDAAIISFVVAITGDLLELRRGQVLPLDILKQWPIIEALFLSLFLFFFFRFLFLIVAFLCLVL